MTSAPSFASVVNVGSGLTPATADTSRTAPTNVTTILTAGSSGTKIEEIDVLGVGTTVAGILCLFRYDGATYHLIDEFAVVAVTPSTTVAGHKERRIYDNLILKSGDSLRVTTQIAGNQSLVKMTAFGADF